MREDHSNNLRNYSIDDQEAEQDEDRGREEVQSENPRVLVRRSQILSRNVASSHPMFEGSLYLQPSHFPIAQLVNR